MLLIVHSKLAEFGIVVAANHILGTGVSDQLEILQTVTGLTLSVTKYSDYARKDPEYENWRLWLRFWPDNENIFPAGSLPPNSFEWNFYRTAKEEMKYPRGALNQPKYH